MCPANLVTQTHREILRFWGDFFKVDVYYGNMKSVGSNKLMQRDLLTKKEYFAKLREFQEKHGQSRGMLFFFQSFSVFVLPATGGCLAAL